MAVARKKVYTPEEYLKLEERSQIRHEFVNGDILNMSGGTITHNQITVNVTYALEAAVRKAKLPCRTFVNDMKLRIKKANMYVYPDVMLVCGKPELDGERQDVVQNPTVIVEVLSESTGNYDRSRKFAAYRQIPTLEEYVMIDQSRVSVEVFRRDKTKFWVLEAMESLKETVRLKSVKIEIPVAAIYEGVDVEELKR